MNHHMVATHILHYRGKRFADEAVSQPFFKSNQKLTPINISSKARKRFHWDMYLFSLKGNYQAPGMIGLIKFLVIIYKVCII